MPGPVSYSDLVVELVARDAVPATLVVSVWNFDLVVEAFAALALELRVDSGVPVYEVGVQVEDQLLVVRSDVLPVVLRD